MIITARFGAAQANLGYQFLDDSGTLLGSRVTSGINTTPETGTYIATATLPADAVAVYWNDTVTLATAFEDLRDALAIEALEGGGGGGAGDGAYTITVTVTDGTDPLQNAIVRLNEGVSSFVATTNASGQAQFSLDAATYSVSVTKAGYSFTPTTRTVSGNEAGTLTNDLEMDLTSSVPPSGNPDLCVVYVYTQDILGELLEGEVLTFELEKGMQVSGGGRVVSRATQTVSTNGSGYASIELEKGLRYKVTNTNLFAADGARFITDVDTLNLATVN